MTAPAATAPFVGRDQQLHWLEQSLYDALRGQPHVVLIPGEAGIGKTRLVAEFRSLAESHGVPCHYSRCYEDLSLPYLPFVDGVLARLSETLGDLEVALGRDARVLQQLLRRDPSRTLAVDPQPQQQRQRLFVAVARAIIKLAHTRPTVLVLDDLHWADRPSLELLEHLIVAVADTASRQPVPLMLIGTHRPIEPHTTLARVVTSIQRERICETLALSGLEEAEVTELISGLQLGRPSEGLVSLLSDTTQGNPLFVQELVRHLVMQQTLRRQGAYLVSAAPVTELRFPDQVTGAIAARVQGLSGGCRRLLTLASVLTGGFSLAELHALDASLPSALAPFVDEAVEQGLLIAADARLEFAHALIRHVFYAPIDPSVRQQLHLRVAQHLERGQGAAEASDHSVEIAHHLVAAGDAAPPGSVVAWARRAADQAFTVFAWHDAALYYEAALAAAASTDEFAAGDRAALHFRAGYAYHHDRDVTPCLAHYERARSIFEAMADVRGLARVLAEKTRAQFDLISVSYGTLIDIEPLRAALELLGEGEPRLRSRILITIAEAYWTAGQGERAQEAAERALAVAQSVADHSLCAHASIALALAHMQALRMHAALQSFEEGLAFARQAQDLWLETAALQRRALILAWLGRFDEAERVAVHGCRVGRTVQFWGDNSLGAAARLVGAAARCDFAAAEEHAREAMTMVSRSRYPWGGLIFLPALAAARCARGAWTEAQDAIDLMVFPGRLFGDPGAPVQFVAWMYGQLIRMHAGTIAADELHQFGDTLRSALTGNVEINSLVAFCVLMEVGGRLNAEELVSHATPALALAHERHARFCNGWVFLVPRLLGVAARVRRAWAEAESHFEAAAELAAGAAAPSELGRTWLDHARMLAARGEGRDCERGAALVQRAATLFELHGMVPFVREAAQLAAELQAPLPDTVAAVPAPPVLSAREIEVLVRLGRGRSDQEVAEELVLSEASVRKCVASLLDKIGVDGRAAAAAYALKKGLLAPAHAPAGLAPASAGALRVAKDAPPRQYRAVPSAQPVVILFTDMEGYTPLIQRLGDAKAQQVLRIHNGIIRTCLSRHGGLELKHTGDGVMVSFPSAGSAVECAIDIQRDFVEHNRTYPSLIIRIRIGLNAGEPIAEEGQLFGAAVNAAARICARATPGSILVSEAVRRLAADKGFTFMDRGRVVLKGFDESFQLFEVDWKS